MQPFPQDVPTSSAADGRHSIYPVDKCRKSSYTERNRKRMCSMITKKRLFQILNLLLLALAMVCLFRYDQRGGLTLKGITSSWFVALGLVNLVYSFGVSARKVRVVVLTVIGLALAMAADILLGIHFMTGTALFAAGHLFYFAAYCALDRFCTKDLIPVAAAGILSLICVLGTPYIRVHDPVMKRLLILYAVIISCMLGKAIGNVLKKASRTRWLLLIGSALFWFSDLMLALNLFGSGGRLASHLCLYTYWPGQYLLAHTLFHYVEDHRE